MSRTQKCGPLTIPSIGLGTWESMESELETALNVALEQGYRHIDTAFLYENEHIIGKVLNEWITSGRLKRESLFITTKLPPKGVHPGRVEKYIKKSLQNLGLEYIDLYLIHFPVGMVDENNVIKFELHNHLKLWTSMENQVRVGRAKAIGLSNFNMSQMRHIMKHCKIKPACNQIELHVFLQQPKLVSFCQCNDITVVAYSPLGAPGFNNFLERIGVEEKKELMSIFENPVITSIAKKHNKTNAQVALRFLLQKDIVVIPKSVTPSRIKENFDLFSFSLDFEDTKKLEQLDAGERGRVSDWKLLPKVEEHPDYPFNEN